VVILEQMQKANLRGKQFHPENGNLMDVEVILVATCNVFVMV